MTETASYSASSVSFYPRSEKQPEGISRPRHAAHGAYQKKTVFVARTEPNFSSAIQFYVPVSLPRAPWEISK